MGPGSTLLDINEKGIKKGSKTEVNVNMFQCCCVTFPEFKHFVFYVLLCIFWKSDYTLIDNLAVVSLDGLSA